jgi:8-oxo-dGTP pyrophosphatase MutT (NUDIX family)
MMLNTIRQKPIALMSAGKRDVRTQFAALCYRISHGKVEVLMVTSRRSKRWIVPKGWPINGKTPSESALLEAWEEAWVEGKVDTRCVGLFSYTKELEDEEMDLPIVAMVYPVKVKSLAKVYPESEERKRKWMRPKRAAERVDEPELAELLRNFNPPVS